MTPPRLIAVTDPIQWHAVTAAISAVSPSIVSSRIGNPFGRGQRIVSESGLRTGFDKSWEKPR